MNISTTTKIFIIFGVFTITNCGFLNAARDRPTSSATAATIVTAQASVATSSKLINTSNSTRTKSSYDPVTDVASGSRVKSAITHPYYRESKSSYDLYMGSGVYIFVLNTGLNTIWNTSGTNANTVQSDYGFDLVTNGGYFTYDKGINGFLPAGRIVDGTQVFRSMVKEFWAPDLDVNLRVTMVYDRTRNIMQAGAQDLIVPRAGTYAFYAGPQVINNGEVTTAIAKSISHWQRRATRTFMIIDNKGRPHLGVTIQGYTLPALASKIQEMKVFGGKYQVINLDGGSSTSLIAGTRYRNTRARLPWFFGVK